MKIEGRRSQRRMKCYLVEAVVPDFELVFDISAIDVDVRAVETRILLLALAHGPEQALRHVGPIRRKDVVSVRRMRRPGLLRAILTPDDEDFDLHRGELEDEAGL